MKRAVVTGAGGFVGYQLVKRLCSDGYETLALTRPGGAAREFPQGAVCMPLDMSEYDSRGISALRGFRGADAFYHMAWTGSSGQARSDYAAQLDNVRYAADAVRLAAKIGCGAFVGAGSIMEDECMAIVPPDGALPPASFHYSIAKHAAFLIAKTEAARAGMDFRWGRISNAYGETDNTSRFVNVMLRRMLSGESCDLTESLQLYDFIYITELARAFVSIGEAGKPGAAYYIGSGRARPLREFVIAMREAAGSASRLNFGAVPFSGPCLGKEAFDAEKLKRDTGFECRTGFSEGILKTIEYIQSEGGKGA